MIRFYIQHLIGRRISVCKDPPGEDERDVQEREERERVIVHPLE